MKRSSKLIVVDIGGDASIIDKDGMKYLALEKKTAQALLRALKGTLKTTDKEARLKEVWEGLGEYNG